VGVLVLVCSFPFSVFFFFFFFFVTNHAQSYFKLAHMVHKCQL